METLLAFVVGAALGECSGDARRGAQQGTAGQRVRARDPGERGEGRPRPSPGSAESLQKLCARGWRGGGSAGGPEPAGARLAQLRGCGRSAGGEETRSQLLSEPRRLQCDTHSSGRGGGRWCPVTGTREGEAGRDGDGREGVRDAEGPGVLLSAPLGDSGDAEFTRERERG